MWPAICGAMAFTIVYFSIVLYITVRILTYSFTVSSFTAKHNFCCVTFSVKIFTYSFTVFTFTVSQNYCNHLLSKSFRVENPGFVQRPPLSHPFSPSNLPRPFASTPATHPKTSLDVLMSSDAANCSALDATDCSSNVFESTANWVTCNVLDLSELQLECAVVSAETPLSSAKGTPRTVRSLFSRLGRRSEQLCRISEEEKYILITGMQW